MKFHYIASQANGKVVEGDLDAKDSAEILQFLARKSLKPISIRVTRAMDLGGVKFFGQPISLSDKIFLVRYLGLMLRAGTDLFKAIDILINDFDKPVLKALLIEIRANLEKGNPFYTTFEKYPKYFSSVFVNLIKAGEASGSLTEVLDTLSESLAKEQELSNKIKAALVYPVILMAMSFLMLILLVTFALPKIANVFLGSGIKPPIFSRIVFGIGLFLNKYVLIILPAMAVFGVGLWFFFFKVYAGRRLISYFGTKIPIIKKVVEQLAFQRFTSILASLMKAGMPIISALEITADAVGSEKIKDALYRIAREGIATGLTIGESFRREPAFPLVITNLIAVSEQAGHIEEILRTLSRFYESEVDISVKTLVAFIEPVLLLFIGVLIGGIAISVIVPIYQLVGGI